MTEESPQVYSRQLRVPQDHACFPGHFPGQPILPGVLLLERVLSMARASLAQPLDACTLFNVKFLASVSPGDWLDLQLTRVQPHDYKFTVHVGQRSADDGVSRGVPACSGQLRIGGP